MSCSTLDYMDHQKPDTGMNFVECLETDVSFHIMSFLDDPADLVRASSVSRVWRQFVIANGLAKELSLKTFPQLSSIVSIVNATEGTMNSVEVEKKQLSLKTFPQLSSIASVVNPTEGAMDSVEVESNCAVRWEVLERDHKVYASLLQAIMQSKVSPKDCIANAVSASSTDNYPDESVVNTLNPRDRFIRRASYWSSKGNSNPEAPETLIYKLRAGIWVITEIDIQPFEAFFQPGKPIYSAKSIRFKMGHLKSPREIGSDLQHLPLQNPADDKFVWTYTSPEFPMTQDKSLQSFKLPEPILCIGGYLLIELLGRVQRQDIDGLFYICVCYVRVLGRPLFPAFDMEILEPNGNLLLKYYPENLSCVLQNSSGSEIPHLRHLEEEMLWERIGLLEDLLRGIQQGPNNPYGWDEEDGDGMNGGLAH